ncbi:ABC transporter substrate-binding protein [Arenibacterium sp. CAU 1754]
MTRIDRRALFTSGAAAALLAASGLSPESRPKRGGRLRIAVSREEGALDRVARGAVFETLTEVAPDGVLRPELATAWQGSSDARIWTFQLRDGVTFHNGAALGAADVVASLHVQADTVDPVITRAEATGPREVRLELANGNPHLPYLLSQDRFAICPANCGVQDGIGTGLYVARRMQPGRHFLGERLTSHWKDGQAGWVDAIDAIVIPDATVRAEALRDGYVDVAELPQPDGLMEKGAFAFHPSAENIALAARRGVGVPHVVGSRGALDDGRIAERWWIA